jgi:O-antigen/teichoic acid export membrane protein
VIAAVTCAGVEVVVHPVLVAIFGSASAPAVPLARILVVGGLFLGLRRVGAATLQGLGYPELSTIAEGIGTGALLVGLVVLTAFAGRTGTAWALSGAGLVVVLIQLHYLRGIDDTQPL